MKGFGLIGAPLSHSMSSEIHRLLFSIKKQDHTYELLDSTNLEALMNNEVSSLAGWNVTIPYKQQVIPYLKDYSEKVRLYHACNTVIRKEKGLYGENTDVFGFLKALESKKISLKGREVLVTGAGGVSSMMVCEAALGGAQISLFTRNLEKAEKLAKEVKSKTGVAIQVVTKDSLPKAEVLLQGTPLGMHPNYYACPIPLSAIKEIPYIFDTIYHPRKTLLITIGEYWGNLCSSGLEMLVYQAAKAQELFVGNTFSLEELNQVEEAVSKKLHAISPKKNIILIGPPASGKSTVGKELSYLVGAKFIDLDQEIEAREEKSIPEIFAEGGEEAFRQIETNLFSEVLGGSGQVISTGGGIVEHNDFSAIDREKNLVLFMDVNFSVLIGRLREDNTRPLLQENLEETLHNMIRKRYPLYYRYTDFKYKISREQDKKIHAIDLLEKLIEAGNLLK